MIVGSPIDHDRMIQVMRDISTAYHNLVNDLSSLNAVLNQYLNEHLNEMYLQKFAVDPSNPTSQENADAAAWTNEIRSWQGSVANSVLNYTGAGTLQDNSYQIAKRANPRI